MYKHYANSRIDGFSHIHRFQMIPDGKGSCKVLYNSRRQVDRLLDEIKRTGKMELITFGQKRDPCVSFFGKLKSVFESGRSTDPYFNNIGVTISENPSGLPPKSNTVIVKTDNAYMKEIDRETLEPIGIANQKKLHPDLKGPLSCAHAQYDHETGDMFNFNIDLGPSITYRVFKSSLATGKTEILATISDKTIPPAYIHSFCLTQDYVILAIFCSHIAGNGAKVLWERNMLEAILPLDPKSKVKWLVVDRKHGKGLVASFDGPPMFCFHTINAYQEPSSDDKSVDIYCDLIEYKSTDVLHRLYYENLISTGPGVSKYISEEGRAKINMDFVRYRLGKVPTGTAVPKSPKKGPPGVAEVVFELAGPKIGELPTINPSFSTKKARYVYTIIDRGIVSWVDGIAKTDLETKETVYWSEKKHTPGEPIFVADDTREGEDAGYLLSVILDGEKGTSYLLCLDAQTMKEVGRAECEVPVGFGFHGNHIRPKLA
jgi:torulene dioxygenase